MGRFPAKAAHAAAPTIALSLLGVSITRPAPTFAYRPPVAPLLPPIPPRPPATLFPYTTLFRSDELEAWLKNGPFGEYRNSSYEHLWGEAPEIDDQATEDDTRLESSSSFWSWLPWVEGTPEIPAPKPVPEREAFYRLANILAGVQIIESLHHVDSAEARRLAEANFHRDGSTPSQGEVDALHDELAKANFRVVIRSNLLSILGDAALKVHIRRFKEIHRPNPGSGGTTVVKTELQESQDGDWWIHRRFLPDGVEYWLETPRPMGLVFHEWKIRARMVTDLGTERV